MKKNIANNAMPRSNPTAFAPRRVRSRKMPKGISGWLARDSHATNAASVASDSAPRPSVCVEVQPADSASTRV